MIGLFKDALPFVKPKPKAEFPRPDNVVFRLHYRLTVAILIVSTVLVSSYAYIDSSGSAIQCMMDKNVGVPSAVINRFCWIMSTFTLPRHFQGVIGEDFVHHGVGPHHPADDTKYHAYYQWVPLMLALQAVMFYTPHWIWKQVEKDRLGKIIMGLNKSIESEQEREKLVGWLADYMKIRILETHEHKMWALKFFLCECLNMVNVIAQIFITDSFLGGEFTTYGTKVLQFPNINPENRVDPMSKVFPRMTKCTFHKYGGSGTIEKLDAMCVLGMNILNEKIYMFLWFWFLILSVITTFSVMLRIVQFCCPNVRERLVKLRNMGYVNVADVEFIVQKIAYSDWLILYFLAQSMEKHNFSALLSKLTYNLSYQGDDKDRKRMNIEEKHTQSDTSKIDLDGSNKSTLKSPAKLASFFHYKN